MAKQKPPETLTVMEAVDTLSTLADLDVRPPSEPLPQQRVKETFQVLNNYLHHLYKTNREQLKEPETQRGIQAMMILAGEAAQKVDRFTSIFKGIHVTDLKEYQDLQKFYLTKIMSRFQKVLESEEAWEAEWKIAAEAEQMDVERKGLRDLETVRRDRQYELFNIKKEDGGPFFNRNLLRHIRLIGEFDETVSSTEEEDPLLKIKMIQDRDLHQSAKEILHLAEPFIADFYKGAMKQIDREFVAGMHNSLMALMLAANGRNLLQNTTGKSCLSYYFDFHYFLRQALKSPDYKNFIDQPRDELDNFSRALLNLSHALCCFFFSRIGTREEAIGYIHYLIGKQKPEETLHEPLAFWTNILDDDENMRALLKKFPSGPILKTLDLFREHEEREGFDPLNHENMPSHLYLISDDKVHITALRIPTPTHQEYINQADPVEEFEGFIRYLASKKQKHLLFNLQDRTAWIEYHRASCLEKLQKEAEFSDHLFVISLPKHTDFYLQAADYQNIDDADAFLEILKDQFFSFEEAGFYFPASMRNQELQQFVNDIIPKIHRYFFGDKMMLNRKNRLDFIEIFYHFLALKVIDLIEPDSISFTCKDAIDVGGAMGASFYAFLRMAVDASPFTKKEKDNLLWMFYTPALTIRDRLIDIQTFNRAVSALAHMHDEIDAKREEVLSAFNGFYSRPLLTSLKVV